MHAVILCGGKGTRLRPLTEQVPKALLPLGDAPLIDLLLQQLESGGFTRVTLAVGALRSRFESHCGDGARWGLEIDYFSEGFPLGTAGALVSLRDRLPENFLVMNGDVLCAPVQRELFVAHVTSGAKLTAAITEREFPLEYGVAEIDERGELTRLREKPVYRVPVLAGLYALSREALLDFEPRRLDVPELVDHLLRHKEKVSAFSLRGEWHDIGTPEALAEAREAWARKPFRFLHAASDAS